MVEPYQLWGIRLARMAVVKLGGYPSLRRLKSEWTKVLKNNSARSLEARLYTTPTEYAIINSEMDHVELREFNSSAQRDQRIIDEAEYFTIVCFLGVGQYERHEKETLEKARKLARKLAKNKKKDYMIYAVNARGNSAFVESTKGVTENAGATIRGHSSLRRNR